jgi:hypothetical protein
VYCSYSTVSGALVLPGAHVAISGPIAVRASRIGTAAVDAPAAATPLLTGRWRLADRPALWRRRLLVLRNVAPPVVGFRPESRALLRPCFNNALHVVAAPTLLSRFRLGRWARALLAACFDCPVDMINPDCSTTAPACAADSYRGCLPAGRGADVVL